MYRQSQQLLLLVIAVGGLEVEGLRQYCEFLFSTATPYNTPGDGSLPAKELGAWLTKEIPGIAVDVATVISGASDEGNWVAFKQPDIPPSETSAVCEFDGSLASRFRQEDMLFQFVGKDSTVWLLRADPTSVKATDVLRQAGFNFDADASMSARFGPGNTAGVIIGSIIIAIVAGCFSVRCRASRRHIILSDDCTAKVFTACLPKGGGGMFKKGGEIKNGVIVLDEEKHTPFMHENPMYAAQENPAW